MGQADKEPGKQNRWLLAVNMAEMLGVPGEEAGLLFSALEKCITLLSTPFPTHRPLPQKVILQVEQNLKKWSFTDVFRRCAQQL